MKRFLFLQNGDLKYCNKCSSKTFVQVLIYILIYSRLLSLSIVFLYPRLKSGEGVYSDGGVRPSVRPLPPRVPFSYPQLLLHHWIKFNETLTDSLLYSPIVHLLFHILIRKIFGVSSSKTWTLSFLNTGVLISYPQLLLDY